MGHKKNPRRMIKIDEHELGRMTERDLALFYEALCSVRFPEKSRVKMAELLGCSVKHYDKVKQGIAHAPVLGWIVASKKLETTLWFDWVEVQKKKLG